MRGCMRALFLILFFCTSSCVPSPFSLVTDEPVKSLSPSELMKYCDPFNGPRGDLWEYLGYTEGEAQTANFKPGEIEAHGGSLTLSTKRGAFSKIQAMTKFSFQGDFDVQIDCRFQFLQEEVNIDQVVYIMVADAFKTRPEQTLFFFRLQKFEGVRHGALCAGTRSYGKYKMAGKRNLESFQGTLRFVRKGKNLVSLCQDKGSSGWKEINNSVCPEVDMRFTVQLHNFRIKRSSITADDPLSVTFEKFRINAAQGIREDAI